MSFSLSLVSFPLSRLPVPFSLSVHQLLPWHLREPVRTHHCLQCWLSEELPAKTVYRRILCFEFMLTGVAPKAYVERVFRCLSSIPHFAQRTFNLAMPLLGTGDAGHDKSTMLSAIVTAAAYWIKAGLGLRVLKLAIFSASEAKALQPTFARLKETFEAKPDARPADIPVDIDIYLAHSPADHSYAESLRAIIMKKQADCKVILSGQHAPASHADIIDVVMRSGQVTAHLLRSNCGGATL